MATQAVKGAMEKNVAAADESYLKYAGFKSYMSPYLQIVEKVSKLIKVTVPITVWDIDKIKVPLYAGSIQKTYFEKVYVNVCLLVSFLEHMVDVKGGEIRSLCNFF